MYPKHKIVKRITLFIVSMLLLTHYTPRNFEQIKHFEVIINGEVI